MRIEHAGTILITDERTLAVTMERDGEVWTTASGYTPTLELADGTTLPWSDAAHVDHRLREFGTGCGIVSGFRGFAGTDYAFETVVWIESSSGDVMFEWIPLDESGLDVTCVRWPGELAFDERRDDWCTLITHCQGTMIPNSWPVAAAPLPFDGRFETEAGYMPWFAQLRGRAACLTICETPWNAGYALDHPASGPYTHIGLWFDASLGRMDHRRTARVRLMADADVTAVAKAYRGWVDEHGALRTLEEKAVRNPSVRELTGRMWMHVGAKTAVQPDSRMYDADHPERNGALVTFSQRARQLRDLHAMGVDRLFMHLDGWGQPGYDNQHPDYLPACREAGGWDGLKALADTAHECGFMFGLHDQYRDYYRAATTFDPANAVRLPDGTMPEHAAWAGGAQTYLCAALAPDYVKRNYREIAAHGVDIDCTYLDVFTCNEGDECDAPEHRMTRRDCYRLRGECFAWLLAHGILTSSEEVADWAVPHLVFCHYAPYDFQMRDPKAPREGVPVPLQNLVYHDCVIEPWMMERIEDGDDYMLYALLNGGAPYLIRDAAYAGFDGDAGDAAARHRLEQDIARCRTVADLHRRVGMLEMTGFEFVDGDWRRQRTTFADGTTVSVDFDADTWHIDDGRS